MAENGEKEALCLHMLSNNGDRDFLVACAYPTKQMFAEMRRNAIVLMCRNAPHTFSFSLLRK